MDECKENQDLILVMHKKALNETLLTTIENFNIFKILKKKIHKTLKRCYYDKNFQMILER